MSKESFLKKIQVKVPHRSGFDKSFKNLFTLPIGTLVPLLCDELPPNSPVDLEVALDACLPPLASKTLMSVDLRLEAFFVPMRLLYGGYQSWFTGERVYNTSSGQYQNVSIPILSLSGQDANSYLKPGSLGDYLGFKFTTSQLTSISSDTNNKYFNLFPFLAYHKVYDDWYRNTLVQNPIFNKPLSSSSAVNNNISQLPYVMLSSIAAFGLGSVFNDGSRLSNLRQRNFGIDYFTNATPSAQIGNPQGISINTSGSSTTLSISSIRTANSMQQWLERNNYAGFKFQDQLRAVYNADLSDGVAQRVLYLGQGRVPIYSRGVYMQAQPASGGGSITGNNPFLTTGAEFGSAYTQSGVIKLIKGFTTQEPGFVFVMCSVVPRVTYSTGILHQNLRYTTNSSQTDLANPILQNTGQQPIDTQELVPTMPWSGSGVTTFGYTDRYADYMVREDELHGLVRDGESLQAFALQRGFTSATIGSQFLEIPKTYLDQVSAVISGISLYGAWVDAYLNYRVAMPLAPYSIPSLQDPAYEHGQTVTLRRGGSRID